MSVSAAGAEAVQSARLNHNHTVHRDVRKQQKNDLWLLVICIRVLSALTLSTFFQPDEYYQSLEPAWQLSFGQASGAWITWEWHHQLRSSIHPFLLAGVYKSASLFNWLFGLPLGLRSYILIKSPHVTHALATAVLDYYTWRLAEKLYGERRQESYIALSLSLISPWQWFAGPRALTNGLEATLTGVALFHWPWEWIESLPQPKQHRHPNSGIYISVILAALAVLLRPTNGLIWLVLTCFTVARSTQTQVLELIQHISLYGTLVLSASYGLDRLFYGFWTFPPARFFGFNVVQNLAIFYGRNRPDYYFTEGLPLLLMTAIPFALVSLYQAATNKINYSLQSLALIVVAMVCVLSLIAHKEVRFLYPMFPLLVILGARPVKQFFDFSPFPHPSLASKKLLLAYMIIINGSVAVYLSYIHQRGPIATMTYLRSQFMAVNTDALILGTRSAGLASLLSFARLRMVNLMGWESLEKEALRDISVAFLMPCHSTPWRSHLIYPEIRAWALTCEPPIGLNNTERENYLDEADQFYEDPLRWLQANMGPVPTKDKPWKDNGWDKVDVDANRDLAHDASSGITKRPWPRYVMFFEQLEEVMQEAIGGKQSRYKECWRTFNTHWHDDWRRKGDIVGWCVDGGVDVQSIVRAYDEARDEAAESTEHLSEL